MVHHFSPRYSAKHPSVVVAFRYDFIGKSVPQAKIVLRMLLFSTGKRGQVVESLFLRVRGSSRHAEFSYWGHGDKDIVRGSGLFVPESGVATYHRFNPVERDILFRFSGSEYSLELVAKLVDREHLVSLWNIRLEMPAGPFDTNVARETAVFFDWSPQQRRYLASVEFSSAAVHAFAQPL